MSLSNAASPEWADHYQEYLAQAAANAAEIRDLYSEIIERIALGELSHQVLDQRLPAFLQLNGVTYANDLAEVSMRYLAGLIESGTAYSYELVERLLPGAAVRPRVAAPAFDTTDWSASVGQLSEFATRHSVAHLEMMRSVLERVASGELTPAEVHAGSTEYTTERTPESVRETVQLYFDMLRGLDEVSSDFATRYLRTVLGQEQRNGFVLAVRGAIGSSAMVRLAVSNTQSSDAAVRCVLTDLRRADGVGPAFEPDVTITPERFTLEPGQERVITLSLFLGRETFEPGPLYVGTLHVLAPGETLLAAPVNVQPFEAPPPPADAAPGRRA